MKESAAAVQGQPQDLLNALVGDIKHPTAGKANFLCSKRKRVFDVAGALILLGFLCPLLFFTACIVLISSPGGALFRQHRNGYKKAVFSVCKFRSMRAAPEEPFQQAVRGDARVTTIGRLLRKTSIDELPQLINVLKGEMSLVGPRPHPLALDERFSSEIPGYDIRFAARPGMTGLAQVSGARGGTPTLDHMRRRIAFDQRYVREASLSLDLKILMLTGRELLFAFSDENAF